MRGTIFPAFYSLFTAEPDAIIYHVHNEYLQAAVDLGLPGLAAFVALQVSAPTVLRRVWQGAPDLSTGWLSRPGVVRALALVLAGRLLAHAGFGLTDATALGAKPGILFWMLLGLITGLYQRVQTWERSPCAVSSTEGRSS